MLTQVTWREVQIIKVHSYTAMFFDYFFFQRKTFFVSSSLLALVIKPFTKGSTLNPIALSAVGLKEVLPTFPDQHFNL